MLTTNSIVGYDFDSKRLAATVRVLFVAVLALFATTTFGCADSMNDSGGSEEVSQDEDAKVDDKNADFATGGKADSSMTENLKRRVFYVANTYSFQELDAFLHQYAARGIVDRRERHGEYDSLRDLDKAYYVGPYAFRQLVEEARSLPNDVLDDNGNGGRNGSASIDRSGSRPVVTLRGTLASELVRLFERAYVNGTTYSPIDCQQSGTATCTMPVGEAERETNSGETVISIGSRNSGRIDSTFDIYEAVKARGSYDRQSRSHEFGPFSCSNNQSPSPYGPEETHYFCDIEIGSSNSAERTVVLEGDSSVLPELGSSRIWEGWLIVDGNPVSTGHFRAQEGQSTYEFSVDADTASRAAKFVLTIEPADEAEGTPSKQKYLAGPLQGGSATITTTRGPTLSGVDLSSASGVFFLAAPSGRNNSATDYRNGIWFIDNSGNSMTAGLDLPTLGEGWTYEGWVVKPGEGPVSTGKFDDPSERDSDAGGPFAGSAGTPPLPGQDFVARDGRRDLTDGYKTVISVEPQPDDSPKPFAVKPLASPISDAGKGTLQNLSLNEAGLTEASVTIR